MQSILPRPFPKLPAKLFQDMQPGGTLQLILAKFHESMVTQGLKRVDFVKPLHRKQVWFLTPSVALRCKAKMPFDRRLIGTCVACSFSTLWRKLHTS